MDQRLLTLCFVTLAAPCLGFDLGTPRPVVPVFGVPSNSYLARVGIPQPKPPSLFVAILSVNGIAPTLGAAGVDSQSNRDMDRLIRTRTEEEHLEMLLGIGDLSGV